MIDVPLAAVANQQFSMQLNEVRYDFTIKETNGCMSASLTRDNVLLFENARLVAGSPVVPFRYMESGNFVMVTENEDLPYFDQFGITQFMLYVNADELAELRAA